MAHVIVGGDFNGPLAIGSLRILLQGLAQVRDGGILAASVDSARTSLLSAWQREASTTAGLSAIVVTALRCGVSVDDALAYPDRLATVTPADVQRVARRWLGNASLRMVAMGDPKWLEELSGTGLGPYQRRNEMGEVIPLNRY